MGKIKTNNKQKSPIITVYCKLGNLDFNSQLAMTWLYGRVNHLMPLSVMFGFYEIKRCNDMTPLILSMY